METVAPAPAKKPKPTAEERDRTKAEREAAKVERERKKAEREAAKAEQERKKAIKLAAREREKEQKAYQERLKRQKARRFLPGAFKTVEQSREAVSVFEPAGFYREHDQGVLERVRDALGAKSFVKVLEEIADVLGCDSADVCLCERRVVSRKGATVEVVTFRYAFNLMSNESLKRAGGAYFDDRTKAWNLVHTDEAVLAAAQGIRDYFKVVIDLGALAVFRNEGVQAVPPSKMAAFAPLPFHIQLTQGDLINAILEERPGDRINRECVYVHDGKGFVPCPEGSLWTQYPFLLIRYGVPVGEPRYASLSTLAVAVEGITFGSRDKKTATAIARFMNTARHLGIAAFTDDPREALPRPRERWPT